MTALTFHPYIAARSCETCRAYHHRDELPAGQLTWTFGEIRTDANGEPVKRPKGVKVPCERDRKACPKGHWRNPIELTEQNWMALDFHNQCEAVGAFPDDAIVRRHAAIIHGIRKQHELSLLRLAALRHG